jgi:hypothetical protein
LAKEAAESKARLESLSSNQYREAKASRIGGSDIRRRQLGDIASILGGRHIKREGTEEPNKEQKKSWPVNTSSDDEEPVVKIHDDKTRSRKQLGDIVAILGGQSNKRKRTEDHKTEKRSRHAHSLSGEEELDPRSRRHRRDDGRVDVTKSKSRRSRDEPEEERSSRKEYRKRERSPSADRQKDDDRSRYHRKTSKERRRDRQRSRSRSPKEHRSTKSRHRNRSPNHKRERSRSPVPEKTAHRSRRHRSSHSTERLTQESKKSINQEIPNVDYDSDPLNDIIGPRPPPIPEVRSRGRGTLSQGSGMDSRFSASYDPTVDVQLDPDEENDWDQALEALRDRQKWKQQGAERLRAAGFTEEEILKWEKGGEKREEDVKWSKPGEDREWDRGKVVDDDGAISVEPSWGRLKGS